MRCKDNGIFTLMVVLHLDSGLVLALIRILARIQVCRWSWSEKPNPNRGEFKSSRWINVRRIVQGPIGPLSTPSLNLLAQSYDPLSVMLGSC